MRGSREAGLVAYRAFSDVAGKGAFFLVTVLSARVLTQQGFGVFSLGTTLGWLAAVVTDFGIGLHLAREVARRPDRASQLLSTWMRVRLATSLVGLLAVSIAIATTGAGGSLGLTLWLFILVYSISGLIEFLHCFFRGLSRSDVESTLTLWNRAAMLACAAAALAWKPDVTTLALSMLIPGAFTLGWSLRTAAVIATRGDGRAGGGNGNGGRGGNGNGADGGNGNGGRGGNGLTRRNGETEFKKRCASETGLPLFSVASFLRVNPFPPISPFPFPPNSPFPLPPIRRVFITDVMPIGLGIVLSALYFRIDVFLIELWKGTGAVAQYNAAFRLVEALRLFPAAVLAVTLPVLCRAPTAKPLLIVASAVTGFALVVSLALWLGALHLVPLVYGQQYADAAPAFRILLLSFPLMSLNYALTHQLIGWNGQRAYAAIAGAALVFNVVLNARLIPSMSIDGAAWSTLWTEVLLTVGCAGALKYASARAATEPLNAAGVTVAS